MLLSRVTRDVWLLAILRGVSLLGDQIVLFALMIHFAHSPHRWTIGAVGIANTVPPVALSPFAGKFLDGVRVKRFLALVLALQGVAAMGLVVTHSIAGVLALLAILGCGLAFTQPGYNVLVAAIVPPEQMVTAQSRLQSVSGVVSFAAPALAGLIVGNFSRGVPFAVDAISFS